MKYTQGGFTYLDLKHMDAGEYNALKYTINKLVLEEEEEMEKAKEEAEEKAKKMAGSKGKGVGMR